MLQDRLLLGGCRSFCRPPSCDCLGQNQGFLQQLASASHHPDLPDELTISLHVRSKMRSLPEIISGETDRLFGLSLNSLLPPGSQAVRPYFNQGCAEQSNCTVSQILVPCRLDVDVTGKKLKD